MTRMDTDQSFDSLILKPQKPKSYSSQAHEMAQAAFTLYDKDKSGCLKKTEFIQFLSTIIMDLGGDEPTIEDIEEIMWDLDTNGDGQINKKQIMVLIDDAISIMNDLPNKPTGGKKKQKKYGSKGK